MTIKSSLGPFSCPQEESIVRSLRQLDVTGYLAHNILMTDPGLSRFPNEHDIVLLLPWGAYTIESKRTSFEYVKLPGNSPPEWQKEKPMMGRAKTKAHVFPGRENPLHIAWKKSQVLRSQHALNRPNLDKYPVYALLVYPDMTTVETTGRERVCNVRVCKVSEVKSVVMADQIATKRSFPLEDLEAVFQELEALSPELSQFVVGSIEFDARDQKLREPGCPVRVDFYSGRDTLSGRPVDIRVYDTSLAGDATMRFLRRVKRRIAALVRLRDPNVIGIADKQLYPECIIVAYERYPRHESLLDAVRKRGHLSTALAVSMVMKLAHTVHRLHGLNVLHLDIRPETVLVQKNLENHQGAEHLLTGLTNPHLRDDLLSAIMYGDDFDASFVSPNLREPGITEKRSRSNDLYSLGALLAYCSMGEDEYRSCLVSRKPIPNTGSHEVDEIVRIATENRPEMRYTTASDFIAALRAGPSKQASEPAPRI